MRNYIILNGKNSNEINGLLIQELPPISKPLIRTEVEEIDGRDGDIVTLLGYSAYDKELTIGLYKNFDVNEVAAYFNSEGTVIFSNEPDKYYYYQITAQIDFERLVRYRTATVTMHCQPFKYSATEQPITEDVSGTVSDEGTNLALENTAEAPFNTLDLKGNTEQNGTPTPSAPVAVQTVTGEQTVQICGKNLFGDTTEGGNISSTTGANIQGATLTRSVNYCSVMPNSTYTISNSLGVNIALRFYDSAGIFLSGENAAANPRTFTVPAGAYRVRFVFVSPNTDNDIQLELGNQPTAYEPYQGQSYEINLGKNLFDKDNIDGRNGYLYNNNAVVKSSFADRIFILPCQPNTTYTISRSVKTTTFRAAYCNTAIPAQTGTEVQTAVAGQINNNSGDSITITTGISARYLVVHYGNANNDANINESLATIQVEKGSQATSYAAYFEPIELCKIGTYQDYIYKSGGKWYVHKAVGKVVLNGSESDWTRGPLDGNATYRFFVTISGIKTTQSSDSLGLVLSDKLIEVTNVSQYNGTEGIRVRSNGAEQLAISTYATQTMTIDNFRTWLATNNIIAYYALATPTDTEINNEALIQQLDDIYNHAHAYKGRTHITSSAATGNVPHIIAAEVGEDNESTITNAGNYLSKPKITVYGSGDISLYINDMHVLQITLGDEGYITIDTAQMEAYKDTLDNLKNRLVIGDYSNARLKPGANKIHFTGTVTKYIVENYSRWL